MASVDPCPNGECPSSKTFEYPPWLDALIRASYFVRCPEHQSCPKSERNHFCIKCCGDGLCNCCVTKAHSAPGHQVLQIRRASYKEAVRVADMSQLVDLAHIQIYVINREKIVFLNSRPQGRPAKATSASCEKCHRSLLDSKNQYCSLECKFGTASHKNAFNRVPKPTATVLPTLPPATVFKVPPLPNRKSDFSLRRKERPMEGNVEEGKAKEEKVETSKLPIKKRILSGYLKYERKEYNFSSSFENPASVSPPVPKRKRTPHVIMNEVNYQQPRTLEEASPGLGIRLDALPLNTSRKRTRKEIPPRALCN